MRSTREDLSSEQTVEGIAVRWNLTEEMARRRWRRESARGSVQIASKPDIKAAALWYANNGIPIFPIHRAVNGKCSCRDVGCEHPGKHPRTPHGFKDASADPVRVVEWWREWPDANIGIPTGATSQLLVVDCDPRNGGPADRDEFIQQFGPLPDTAEVITGGGGRHYFFRYGGGAVPKTIGMGIDVKGDGGYVVVPPSLHPSGNLYEWDGISGAEAILSPAELPRTLTQRITAGHHRARGETTADSEKWAPGERNTRLASIAGTMQRRGMTQKTIEVALLEENRYRCDPPLTAAEVRAISESIARYPPAQPNGVYVSVHEWSEPLPFSTLQVDPIPSETLPDWLGEMARAVSEATETPFALPSLLSLAVVSACVAGKAEVSPEPGYFEPLNLFTCPAMESGNRKSAVFNCLMAPLVECEREAVERVEPLRRHATSERRTTEARIERLRRKAAAAPQDMERLTRDSRP